MKNNNYPVISIHHRVVKTSWACNNPQPLSTTCIGTVTTESAADNLVRQRVQSLMDILNKTHVPDIFDCATYDFRSDFDGNAAAIIRFWDGDDYQIVAEFDIHEITESRDKYNMPTYLYRGYQIHALPNQTKPEWFGIRHDGSELIDCLELDDALQLIDYLEDIQASHTAPKTQPMYELSYIDLLTRLHDDVDSDNMPSIVKDKARLHVTRLMQLLEQYSG